MKTDDMQNGPRFHLGYLLNQTAMEIRERTAAVLESTGIHPRQFGLLVQIDAHGPMTQRELGRRHGVDRTTMVALLDHLEKHGMVERRTDPTDRRCNLIHLTEQGTRALRDLGRDVDAVEDEFMKRLDPGEGEELRRLLGKLLAGVREPDSNDGETDTTVSGASDAETAATGA